MRTDQGARSARRWRPPPETCITSPLFCRPRRTSAAYGMQQESVPPPTQCSRCPTSAASAPHARRQNAARRRSLALWDYVAAPSPAIKGTSHRADRRPRPAQLPAAQPPSVARPPPPSPRTLPHSGHAGPLRLPRPRRLSRVAPVRYRQFGPGQAPTGRPPRPQRAPPPSAELMNAVSLRSRQHR